MKRIALAILCLALASWPAHAQTATKKAPLIELNGPCNPLGDTRPQCQAQGSPPPIGQQSSTTTPAAGDCTFGTFVLVTVQNLKQTIQNCGETFLNDTQAALDSATAAKDVPAINCLTPAVAFIKAGIGTPASPGDPTASPPMPATAAKLGGPVLLFQKFREFVLAGGITNCQGAFNSTVASATSIRRSTMPSCSRWCPPS
jgi:hypothetical protein